jgi:beta-glucanase (GH16 family)
MQKLWANALMILCTCGLALAAPPPTVWEDQRFAYTLVWEDSFDGASINSSNWVVGSLRDPVSNDLVPGAVGDHLLNWNYQGYITEEDTYLDGNGNVVLRNQKRSYQGSSPNHKFEYTSGHLMSMHRVFLNKGYVEFRAQFPHGEKVWPALWLIAEDLHWGPEWDMWEYFGWKNHGVGYDVMGMHLCHGTWPNEKWSSDWIWGFNSNYNSSAWHVYGFEWTDTAAVWLLDGVVVRTLTRTNSIQWPDKNMYLVLNNGVKTNSPEGSTTWPNELVIDYVKIYSATSVPETTGVYNRGNDCWRWCGEKAGSCTYCGSGLCCRQNWESDPAECGQAEHFMNENHHECVAVMPTPQPTPPQTPQPSLNTSNPTAAPTLALEDHPELKMFLELMSLRTSHPTPLPTSLPTAHPTSLPTSHPTPVPTPEPTLTCTDRSEHCSLWEPYCNSEQYGEFVRAMCRSSCDACITQDCADEYGACEVWKERGLCETPRFAPFLNTYCKKSCDSCGVHRRMSTDSMEFSVFEMPDAPPELEEEVAADAMILGSVLPLNLRGSVVRVV